MYSPKLHVVVLIKEVQAEKANARGNQQGSILK